VLGIQFDIGLKDASATKMKMIDDLFKVRRLCPQATSCLALFVV